MKKIIIAALVGALILQIWQTLSWAILDIHGSSQTYTANQDKIMEFLGENLDEGFYYLPNVAPGSEANPMEEYMEKPWAQVFYHDSYDANMGINSARGFVINFLCVLLLGWILMKMGNASFQTILLASLAVGLIAYFNVSYIYSIWFQTNTIGNLIDALVSWGLVGAWLGWWLRR